MRIRLPREVRRKRPLIEQLNVIGTTKFVVVQMNRGERNVHWRIVAKKRGDDIM